MSSINTNNINVNYPTPGVNNSTQGFRDNFTSIKTNLNYAGTEITELQNKVVLKSGLTGQTVNNDMANTLISNAVTRSFRASTYNIGNNVQGATTINVSQGDVQIGSITADTTLSFGGWSPTDTQSNVELNLFIANTSANITFPSTIVNDSNVPSQGMTYTIFQLENYVSNPAPAPSVTFTNTISVPKGVTQLYYLISTKDCGVTLDIYPINRPKKSSFVINGTPSFSNVTATGTISTSTTSNSVTGVGTAFTTELTVGRQIVSGANVFIGTVANITNSTTLTLTANANIALAAGNSFRRVMRIGSQGDKTGAIQTDGSYIYLCTGDYDASTSIWKRISPTDY